MININLLNDYVRHFFFFFAEWTLGILLTIKVKEQDNSELDQEEG